MKLEVWSLPGCSRCEDAKARLRAANVEIVEQDLSAVKRAEVRDVDVLTQATLQNGEVPVIRIVADDVSIARGANFVEPAELDGWLEKLADGGGV